MFCLSYLNGFLDERQVSVQQLFCGVLLPGFVQDSIRHSCVAPIELFLCFVSIHVVHRYSSSDTATVCKRPYFILLDRSVFHMIDNLSLAFHAFTWHMLTSLSVDEMLNWFTNYRSLPFRVEMAHFCLKHMYSVLFAFT